MIPLADDSIGSSPHTRGALKAVHGVQDHGRIIPAYAGCTSFVATQNGDKGDHPRIRGVHCR